LLSKSLPSNTNPFLGLVATYGVAFIGSMILFWITKNTIFANEKNSINIFNLIIGMVIIGIEGGYMLMYRAGWEVSKASVFANIVLAGLLLILGAVLFKESMDAKKIIGVVLCALGITLLK
jgi:uncharacterized membrane protein